MEVRKMKYNKKYFGNVVDAILKTIIETWCVMNDETITDIVNMFNTAHIVAAMWDLKEIEKVENHCQSFNQILACDNSEYRIIKEDNTYLLVKFA